MNCDRVEASALKKLCGMAGGEPTGAPGAGIAAAKGVAVDGGMGVVVFAVTEVESVGGVTCGAGVALSLLRAASEPNMAFKDDIAAWFG